MGRMLALWLLLAALAAPGRAETGLCRVVLVQTEGFSVQHPVVETAPGQDVEFLLQVEDGYTVEGCDYPDCLIQTVREGVLLRLRGVRFTRRVHVFARRTDVVFTCHACGGTFAGGGEVREYPCVRTHLRLNTPRAAELHRDGFTLLGWNTHRDGSGLQVGAGSRMDPEAGTDLYAQWSPWSDPSLFTWEPYGDGAAVTGYTGSEEVLTVPGMLGEKPVRVIREGALALAPCRCVILPESLRTVENGAFSGCPVEEVYLFDSLLSISDYAFAMSRPGRLHIQAAVRPAFCGTYYATFTDKLDRLMSLEAESKIVLFSGSSTRFGYDSRAIRGAFPAREVVNMGVFAYTNALPQLDLIRQGMREGDILIHSPEFDAAQRQFCTGRGLDEAFFRMIESDYDVLLRLDLTAYDGVLTAFQAFLSGREGMERTDYALSPADWDEDGQPAEGGSYNEYGDYVLFRPNASDDAPVYGLPVRYTPEAFPRAQFLEPLNRVYRTFLSGGVRVFFAYAPRNRLAISEDSTPEAREALDRYLREGLCVPVLGGLEDSLVSGKYLYGTDNHLSTEGVAIRTQQTIEALRAALGEGENNE